MGWINKWRSNMVLRNMAADIFGRSAYSRTPGNFVPYFQYKIGDYRPDHYLYFPKEPYRERYYNEFFNKLCEYKGYDIIHFLEFHFSAYPDQHDFLRFLHYELSDRMQMKITETKLKKLQSAFEWVQEKQQEWKESQKGIIKQEIEQGVREIFTDQPAPNPAEVEQFMQKISAQLGDYIDKLMAETEERMSSITERLPAGRIELNNRNHEEKIIQLLILWQQVQAPPELARAEQLFKKFTAMDIATILHLHFEAFRDNKIPTLQKKIGEQNERLKMNHPPVKKLVEALQTFFYGK